MKLLAPILMVLGSCAHQSHSAGHSGGHHSDAGDPMEHRFVDAQKWAERFESPERQAWQEPDKVVAALNIHRGSRIADLGAGTGYFSVRLARAAPEGRVWAVDIEPTMVEYLQSRARRESHPNLFGVLATHTASMIPEPVDLILVVNTYHHIGDRVTYLRKLQTRIATSGRVAIVDFLPGDLPVGPPAKHKVDSDQVIGEFKAAGFVLLREHKAMKYQYFLEFAPARDTIQ